MVSYILTESDKCFFEAMESGEEHLQLKFCENNTWCKRSRLCVFRPNLL